MLKNENDEGKKGGDIKSQEYWSDLGCVMDGGLKRNEKEGLNYI